MGFAFFTFGLGSLVLSGLVIPLVAALGGGRGGSDHVAQRLLHRGFRFYRWLWVSMGFMTVREIGTERLRGLEPRLVVANHPTLIDMVILGSILPQMDCIAGARYASHPALRGTVAAARYIRNDDGPSAVDECVGRLQDGRTLLIFPEGTRSPMEGLWPFHRGAAHVALRSGCELLPVVITCEPPALMKGQKWRDMPEAAFEITVRVEEPISPKPAQRAAEGAGRQARRLTAELRETFIKRLGRG